MNKETMNKEYYKKLTEETNLLGSHISELENILISAIKKGFSEDDKKNLMKIGTDIIVNAKKINL